MPSAYASYDLSYPQRTPYISTTEYVNAPTAIDITQLLPGQSNAAQINALQEVIDRACSWVDEYTCGAWGTLCATQNAEDGRVWGSRMGTLAVHPKYWPILSVDSFSYSAIGWGFPSTSASLDPSTSVWIEPQQFIVQPHGVVSLGLTAPAGITTTEYYCQWTYTNGWPNTTLAASVTAGDTTIQPNVVTGLYPGTLLTLYDIPSDEAIQVDASYTPGDTTVPLVSPLQYNHQATATITNLPPAVKQAAILATGAFIKQRGSGGLIVSDITGVTQTEQAPVQNLASDLAQAKMLLDPLRVMFVGY